MGKDNQTSTPIKKKLVSVEDAMAFVHDATEHIGSEKLVLHQCAGRILAKDIVAAVSLPPFDQSAMDGYAVRYDDATAGELRVTGLAPAGKSIGLTPGKNEAIRIFTGAMMPAGTDTVIKQEDVEVSGDTIRFSANAIVKGQNVRLKGAQIDSGIIAMQKGTRLNPGSIGYLAALGIHKAEVARLPKVSIVVTGNELKDPGEPLEPGEVYESNSVSLIAALNQFGIIPVSVRKAIDDPEIIRDTVHDALGKSDVVLITGGVSVGDLDYTSRVLMELEVETIFHGVSQRPGKPFYFGKRNSTFVFGLPGNPASVLSCFYVYVTRALARMQGCTESKLLCEVVLPLKENFKKHANLTYFLKGRMEGELVHILPGQDSFILSSFSDANCLVVAPFGVDEIQAGTPVTCYVLP